MQMDKCCASASRLRSATRSARWMMRSSGTKPNACRSRWATHSTPRLSSHSVLLACRTKPRASGWPTQCGTPARPECWLPSRLAHHLAVDLLPLGAAVEHDGGIDKVELNAVEHRPDFARRRHEFALEHDLLPVAEHEIIEQQC